MIWRLATVWTGAPDAAKGMPLPRKTPSFLSAETGASSRLRKTAVDGLVSAPLTAGLPRRYHFARLNPSCSQGLDLDIEFASYSARGRAPCSRRLRSFA